MNKLPLKQKTLNLGCGNQLYGDVRVDKYGGAANLVADVEAPLPFKDESFEIVYSRFLFEHLRNPSLALKEMVRVLKRGGKLVLITDNAAYPPFHLPSSFGSGFHVGGYKGSGVEDKHYGLYTPEHLAHHFQDAGLKIEILKYVYADDVGGKGGIWQKISRLLRICQVNSLKPFFMSNILGIGTKPSKIPSQTPKDMTTSYPLVSVVIPTHNRKGKLVRLINSIQRCKYPQSKIEIIVVDDASTDKTLGTLKEYFPEIRILRNDVELLPSACRNLGIKNSQGEYIFLVDDDNVLDENALGELVKVLAKHKDVAIVGPIMYYHEYPTKVWCAGARLYSPIFIPRVSQGINTRSFSEKQLIECDYVPNTFMIKRTITNHIGFFDERLPIGWEETDFALRTKRKNYRVVISSAAKVFHDVSVERDVHVTEHRAYWRGRNRIVIYRKYAPIRCFFILIDIVGFTILLLRLNKDVKKHLSQYIKGIKNGLTCNLNSKIV